MPPTLPKGPCELALRTTSPERSASLFEVETRSRASLATSAVRRTVAVIWSRAAAVSSRLAACCSVRRDRSSAADVISSAPDLTPFVLVAIACIVPWRFSIAALKSPRSFS